jgi:hypothetical protein
MADITGAVSEKDLQLLLLRMKRLGFKVEQFETALQMNAVMEMARIRQLSLPGLDFVIEKMVSLSDKLWEVVRKRLNKRFVFIRFRNSKLVWR